MGCPHRSHLVKTASIGPTPLSVSGALLLYSLRLLSQFLIRAPSLLYRRDRLAYPAQPGPSPLSPVLGDGPHELAPDNHPVGLRRRLGRRLRRPYAEPERHRNPRLRPHPPQQLHGLRRQAVPHPGDPRHGDAVDEPRRERHGLLNPGLRRRRGHERAEADAAVRARLGERGRLVDGEVRYHEARDPRLRRLVQEAPGAPGEDGVVVEQEHHGHAVREAGGEGQAVAEVCPVLDGAGGGVLDRRPVGQRVGEGNPYLQHVGPGSDERLPPLGRPVKRRVATGEVRHEGRASPRESLPEPLSPAHEGSSPASRASMPKASATTPMSLSPRPERLMTRFLPGPSSRATFSAWWIACEVSSAGMIPSRREHITKAANASSSVAPTYSTRPSSLR